MRYLNAIYHALYKCYISLIYNNSFSVSLPEDEGCMLSKLNK